jgi:hypothetical protein
MTHGTHDVERRLLDQMEAGAQEIEAGADARDAEAADLEAQARELRAQAAAARQRAERIRAQAGQLLRTGSFADEAERAPGPAAVPPKSRRAPRKRPLSGKRRALAERLREIAPESATSRDLLAWYDATRADRGEPAAEPYAAPEDLEAALTRLEDPLWYLRAQGLAERVAPRTWRWTAGAEMP